MINCFKHSIQRFCLKVEEKLTEDDNSPQEEHFLLAL